MHQEICETAVSGPIVFDAHCFSASADHSDTRQSAIGDSLEKQTRTVGRVHPHLEVKIVNESGRVVERGATGELCTRGYSVMRGGYWGEPAKTNGMRMGCVCAGRERERESEWERKRERERVGG